MNVTDQWMLERMQQMAANMAAGLQQNTQSNETPKTEKGESFQDLMNKTKDQKLEAPKKDSPDRKTEAVQDKAPAQETQPKKITRSPNPGSGPRHPGADCGRLYHCGGGFRRRPAPHGKHGAPSHHRPHAAQR